MIKPISLFIYEMDFNKIMTKNEEKKIIIIIKWRWINDEHTRKQRNIILFFPIPCGQCKHDEIIFMRFNCHVLKINEILSCSRSPSIEHGIWNMDHGDMEFTFDIAKNKINYLYIFQQCSFSVILFECMFNTQCHGFVWSFFLSGVPANIENSSDHNVLLFCFFFLSSYHSRFLLQVAFSLFKRVQQKAEWGKAYKILAIGIECSTISVCVFYRKISESKSIKEETATNKKNE